MAASVANSTARRFSTGSAPGKPRHTGQTLVFGGSPKCVEQEQKILLAVRSWTCTSRPITGSYLARADTEMSGVVAISGDYKAASQIVWGLPETNIRLVRFRWGAQILLQRDFKIHQFVAFCVSHPGEIEVCARQGHGNARDIKEQESGLRAMRLDGLGNKLGILDLLYGLLAHAALHFLRGKWNRITVGAGGRPSQPPGNVIVGGGRKFGTACCDQLRLHAGKLDGLVAVICHRHKNGDEPEFAVLNRKYLRLVRQIVGIDGDRDSFRGMLVVGRISFRRLRLRHDEF